MSISEAGEALVDAVNEYGAAVAAKLNFPGLENQLVFVSEDGETMALEGGDLLILHRRVDNDTDLADAKTAAEFHNDWYPILDTRDNTAWRYSNNAWVSESLATSPAFPVGRIYKDVKGFRSYIFDLDHSWVTLGAPGTI